MSGKNTNYRCQCSREGRELISNTTTVTFIRKANVTIIGNRIMSQYGSLSLKCSSDVPVYESMTWKLERKAGGSPDLQDYIGSKNETLNMPNVLQYWEGRYTCTVSQGISSSSSSANITILPLPSASQLTTNIVDELFTCPSIVKLNCSTTDSHKYRFQFKVQGSSTPLNPFSEELEYNETAFNYTSCENDKTEIDCIVSNSLNSTTKSIILRKLKGKATCTQYGEQQKDGQEGDTIIVPCKNGLVGTITIICKSDQWVNQTNNCIPERLKELVTESQELQAKPPSEIPIFLDNLSSNVNETNITFAVVNAVVDILETLSKVTTSVDFNMMKNFLNTADVVVKKQDTWEAVNETQRIKGGSRLLQSTETFSQGLQINKSITQETETIILKGIVVTNETDSYKNNFPFGNTTGEVVISNETLASIRSFSLITIAYSSLSNILTGNQNQSVNGLVMSTVVSGHNGTNSREDFKISMTFEKINRSLSNASCVFWKFNANGSGEWNTMGCRDTEEADQVLCTCDHLTAFSILMSSSPSPAPEPNITEEERKKEAALEYITYIGVGISMGSLVLCLIIETMLWKSVTKNKTSYMRHVCLVNIAVSLLIADIWFIIGASLTPQLSNQTYTNATTSTAHACDAATFFTHFFYLALFFWMLTMGLILFYRLVFVLSDMSKTTMLAIAFSLGYGCPLIISVVTVAVTRPHNYYREGNSCWLNMLNTRAFLAFVIPALTIVAVNFIILAVVIITLLRPSVGDKPRKEEKSTLVKIAKSIAILTPLLGLTWGFGIGTLLTTNFALKVIFSLLNSLQGFFILVFGSLMDAKTREALLRQFSLTRWASQLTKSSTLSTSRTPPTTPKSTPSKPKAKFFGRRGAYNLSSALQSHSSEDSSHSYSALQ